MAWRLPGKSIYLYALQENSRNESTKLGSDLQEKKRSRGQGGKVKEWSKSRPETIGQPARLLT